MSQNVYRASAKERSFRKESRAKVKGVRRHPNLQRQEQTKVFKGWVGLFLLFPLGLVTALTLGEMFWRAVTRMEFWRREELVFFVIGGLVWGLAYMGGWKPVRTYVFGHELSHLLVARAFGGKIIDWDFTAQGGYVETNKSNTWISLAPYLIPLYSIGVLLLLGLACLFWDVREACHLELAGRVWSFKPIWGFYILLGLTWWFHVTFTFKTIIVEQSDLERNGEFFSILLIFLINVLLLVALFLAASPSPGLGLAEVGRCWWNTAMWLLRLFFGWLV